MDGWMDGQKSAHLEALCEINKQKLVELFAY